MASRSSPVSSATLLRYAARVAVVPRGSALRPFRNNLLQRGITRNLVLQYLDRGGAIEDLVREHNTSYEEILQLCA